MSKAPRRFEIDLDAGVIPIAGRIRLPLGEPRQFSGYVELINALESLRIAAAGEHSPTSSGGEADQSLNK